MTTYSADEFLHILSSEEAIPHRARGPSVTGWARKHQDGFSTALPTPEKPFILFSNDYATWIPIPLAMIESVESLSPKSFRWRPPRIRLPRIQDPRETWRKNAEKLAWATAARIDAATSGNYCPKIEIRAGLYALAATFAVGAQTPESKFMGLVIIGLAAWLPDEYCKGR